MAAYLMCRRNTASRSHSLHGNLSNHINIIITNDSAPADTHSRTKTRVCSELCLCMVHVAFFWLDAAKTKGRDKWRSLWVQPGDQKKYKISLHNSTITIM